MPFISKSEFKFTIRTSVIDVLTAGDDTVLDELTDLSVLEIKGYLRGKYSGDTLFLETGTSRNKILTKLTRDITLYHLYSIYNFRKIPSIREQRYLESIEYLKNVQDEKINPFMYTGTTGFTHFIIAGGNDRRENHQT